MSTQQKPIIIEPASTKSGKVAFILCISMGVLGVHRFYVGKIGTGILTLLTVGLFGIWPLIDAIVIIQNKFKDKNNRPLLCMNAINLNTKLVLIITTVIIWIISTIALLLGITAFLTQDLVVVAEQQLMALRQGNINQAYSYTAKEYQQIMPLKDFQTWIDQYPELKNIKSIAFYERGINSYKEFLDGGNLEGILTTDKGKSIKMRYVFTKTNGLWKILSVVPVEH